MTSTWDTFSKSATATSDGDFPDKPYVKPGQYHGEVIRVSEPYDKANPQNGEMQTKFVVDFRLTGARLKGETPVLPAFFTLPPKYLDEGFLSEKSNLYKVLKAFGTDMDDEFEVAPNEWPANEFCDVIVEDGEKADAAGNKTSWITKYLPCSCIAEEAEEAPPPKKEPVAAGRAVPNPLRRGAVRGDWNE